MKTQRSRVAVSELKERKNVPSLRRVLSYYPIRYHLCAFAIAYIFFNASSTIHEIQEQALVYMFSFLDSSLSFSIEQINALLGRSGAGGLVPISYDFYPTFPIILIYIQIPFLVFFPTVAFTARTSFAIRGRILFFGLLTFSLFTLILFFDVFISGLLGLGPIRNYGSLIAAAGFSAVVGGSLLIELMLFSSITKPTRRRIRPIIKRSYSRNYAYLIALIASAVLSIYMLSEIAVFFKENPVVVFAAIHILNPRTIAIFGSYISFFLHRIGASDSSSRKSATSNSLPYAPTITFLVPAANEEKLIARCIKSIDDACYKYPIKNEIIVVDDGSTDGTARQASETLKNLKHCTGKLYTIPNSGKGTALQYGLEKAQGEILFRIDADSLVDREAIEPIVRHFQDPTVGSVGGMIIPLEPKSHWQKMVVLFYILFSNLNRRTQSSADSVLVQPGAFSVFRRADLIKVGGWTQNQFGEDGEITNRIGRCGYKVIFEPDSLMYGDVPESLQGIMSQRARWNIAYYHSRGRHLDLVTDIREFRRPRSIFFLLNILSHGGAIGHGLMWSTFAAVLLAGTFQVNVFSHMPALLALPFEVLLIPVVIYLLTLIMLLYYLQKYLHKVNLVRYFPVVWLYSIINMTLVVITAMEVALFWSSKWKKYSDDAYLDLRKEIKKGVDPLHG
jgi:cellulose synthase/poly-beta-1,6-N-acetylglucosamine synthase-like glycosyltransferase